VHAHDPASLAEARQRLLQAHRWSDTPVDPLPLFYGIVTQEEGDQGSGTRDQG
jgi:hypothetical protein